MTAEQNMGFEPEDCIDAGFPRVSPALLNRLASVRGLAGTVSDILDTLGWRLCLPSTIIKPVLAVDYTVVGQAITLRYLPQRRSLDAALARPGSNRLAHHAAFRRAAPGDVLVVEASSLGHVSMLGGRAASAAVKAGIAAVIVDGGVRDIDEIRDSGLPIWSAHRTPITGKGRAEATSINRPISCAGVQVRPGDVVIADPTGICFVPVELIERISERVREIESAEAPDLITWAEPAAIAERRRAKTEPSIEKAET